MTLRKKTLIIISATVVSLLLVLYAASRTILLDGFAELEEQHTRQNVERARSALLDELSVLDTMVFDWAAWDDTYTFIKDANEEYIESNLVDETFTSPRLNFMLFINSAGQTVFSKGFDLYNEEEMPVPESLQKHLADDALILRHPDTESSLTGIVLLPEGPMLVASRPILTSEEEGSVRGTLIMGHYLDSAEIERLAEITHLSLTLRRFDDAQMSPDFQAARSSLAASLSEKAPIFVQPLDAESSAGYVLVRDIYGEPSLVLRADMPRGIYKQGQASVLYFLSSLLAVSLVFGVVTMLLLEKAVLSRMARLSADVSSIGASSDLSARVSVMGKDELSSLADAVNGMLAALEQSHSELRESEERYRLLFNSGNDMVFVSEMTNEGAPGKLVEANDVACRRLGYTREELLQLSPLDIAAPESGSHFPALAEKLLTEKQVLFETVGIAKDGTKVPVEIGTHLFDLNGQPAVLSIACDITERKQAEGERERLLAQIQEQAQQVQQIIDTVPEGLLLLDAAGQVILVNPVAEKDVAVLASAGVGDTLTHLGDRPLAELLTSPPKGLWHEVTTDGRSFEIIARPLEAGPEPEGWVLVIRDVTREREIQQRAQQQERLAMVGQLAAGIAHDFNNIMATIVLYAQMLSQTEGLSPRSRERLATINQQATHAVNLIRQILDFSRRAVLERQPMNLLPFVKEQIKLLERTLPENIKIDLSYGLGEYTLNADPTRMQQVMMNLALNARDAMPEGGNLRIGLERIRIEDNKEAVLPEMEAGDWVRVTVSDTGAGIPPDDLPHVFDPFFTTKTPGKGTGLGLAQVHGIVKQHEGEIDVESQVGRGTTFTVYLPALPVHPAEAPTLELPALARGREETILVVEDNRATREALVDSLELLDYRGLAAADGREALAVMEQHGDEIALVLSDVVMPRMGGIALLHALRQRGLAVGVVMLTGHPLEERLGELQAQGLADWLPKPPSLERLTETVARALKEDRWVHSRPM